MRTVLILAIACLVPISVSAFAQEGTLEKIKTTGAITIGHRDSSVPFSYVPAGSGSEPVGFAIDICMDIVSATGDGSTCRR